MQPSSRSRRMVAEQPLDLVTGERRGGLVEQDDAAAAQQRLGALHLLLLRDRQMARELADIDGETQRRQRLLRLPAKSGPVDPAGEPCTRRQLAHEHGLRHRQLRHQRRLLRHQVDAALVGIVRGRERDRGAIEAQLAGGRAKQPGKDLEQRGFAGAVLAHHRVDAAGPERQADPTQDGDAPERLGDIGGLIVASGDGGRFCCGVRHLDGLPGCPFNSGNRCRRSARRCLARTVAGRPW